MQCLRKHEIKVNCIYFFLFVCEFMFALTIGRPWLEYSQQANALFCFPCRFFPCSQKKNDAFTVDGFSQWNDVARRLDKHVGDANSAHNGSCALWEGYKATKIGSNVANQV
jgi:hypothetical protein